MSNLKDIHAIQVSTLKNVLTITSGKPKTITKVAKETDMTYAHVNKLIKSLESLGYITTEKLGRNRLCSLTEKGNALIIQLQNVDFSLFKQHIRIYSFIKVLGSMDTQPKIIRTIQRETGILNNSMNAVIDGFDKCGLITTIKSGRIKNCIISGKGKALYREMKDL